MTGLGGRRGAGRASHRGWPGVRIGKEPPPAGLRLMGAYVCAGDLGRSDLMTLIPCATWAEGQGLAHAPETGETCHSGSCLLSGPLYCPSMWQGTATMPLPRHGPFLASATFPRSAVALTGLIVSILQKRQSQCGLPDQPTSPYSQPVSRAQPRRLF